MATEYQYECCLIGGTFDRFHSGHKLLISAALTKCQSVEIYITTDEMALKKSLLIQDYALELEICVIGSVPGANHRDVEAAARELDFDSAEIEVRRDMVGGALSIFHCGKARYIKWFLMEGL